MLEKVIEVVNTEFGFDDFNRVRDYFKRIINLFKQMNYSEFKSEKFRDYESQLHQLITEKTTA